MTGTVLPKDLQLWYSQLKQLTECFLCLHSLIRMLSPWHTPTHSYSWEWCRGSSHLLAAVTLSSPHQSLQTHHTCHSRFFFLLLLLFSFFPPPTSDRASNAHKHSKWSNASWSSKQSTRVHIVERKKKSGPWLLIHFNFDTYQSVFPSVFFIGVKDF